MLCLLIISLSLGFAVGNAPSPCCGFVNRATRIVGGQETEVREYPWQAGIVHKWGQSIWCGGSVINDRFVLTAAHCLEDKTADRIEVLLGEHEMWTPDGEERFDVAEIIVHPMYENITQQNDFALLKLASTISFDNNQIAPACLPSSGDFSDVDAIVTGWGHTSEGGQGSNTLREVTVHTMTNQQCRQKYYSLTDAMLCAGADGKDACHFDSGGPLVTEMAPNRYQQIGVVSYGIGCARPDYPGVYARVTSAYTWIREKTADANLC